MSKFFAIAVVLLALVAPCAAQQSPSPSPPVSAPWSAPDPSPRELLTIINEHDQRYNQRFDAQERAVTAALTAAKEAVTKAEAAAEKRFDSVNEFRGQLKDQAATFVTRTELYAGLVAGLTLAIGVTQLMLQFARKRES